MKLNANEMRKRTDKESRHEQLSLDYSALLEAPEVEVKPAKRKYECFAKKRKKKPSDSNTAFDFIDPDGNVHRGKNLKKFCTKKDLNYDSMRHLANDRQKCHKGWRRYTGSHTGRASNVRLAASTLTEKERKQAKDSLKDRNALITSWLPRCDRVAAHYSVDNFELKDDLTQVARFALVWAATKFCEQGSNGDFAKYGMSWIKNSIRSFLGEEWRNNKNQSLDKISCWREEEERFITAAWFKQFAEDCFENAA